VSWLDPTHLINTFGVLGLVVIIFAESGLFFGFFLPGDSLLVTAGLLASTTKPGDVHLNIVLVVVGAAVAAVAGDQVGYIFGRNVGRSLFSRPKSRLFRPEYLNRAHDYLEERGARMIVLARFVPAVRTFTPIVAGAGEMRYRVFMPFNVIGGVLWGCGLPLAGYVLGTRVSHIDRYLVPIIAVVIVVSFIPVIVELLRARRNRAGATTDS
jgi:membrane-associated protein